MQIFIAGPLNDQSCMPIHKFVIAYISNLMDGFNIKAIWQGNSLYYRHGHEKYINVFYQ